MMALPDKISTPIFSSVIKNRAGAAALCAVAVIQGALLAGGIKGFQCPLLAATGCPCPGCGITRASMALLRGEWRLSLTLHAFAPILLASLALLAFSCVLPSDFRLKFCETIEELERRTGLTTLFLIGLLIYWLVRLFFIPASLALVVQR